MSHAELELSADGRVLDAVVLPYPSGPRSGKVGIWLPLASDRLVFMVTPRGATVSLAGRFTNGPQQTFSLDEIEQFASALLGGIRSLRGAS